MGQTYQQAYWVIAWVGPSNEGERTWAEGEYTWLYGLTFVSEQPEHESRRCSGGWERRESFFGPSFSQKAPSSLYSDDKDEDYEKLPVSRGAASTARPRV